MKIKVVCLEKWLASLKFTVDMVSFSKLFTSDAFIISWQLGIGLMPLPFLLGLYNTISFNKNYIRLLTCLCDALKPGSHCFKLA